MRPTRRLRCLGLILGLVCLGPGTATAGVYNPGESDEAATYPDFINGPPGKDFREVVMNLRIIPLKQPEADKPVRRRYVFMEEMISRAGPGGLKSPEDRLQASAVLIRRRKFDEAEQLLRPLALSPEGRDNIPIQSNFAACLHMKGDLANARDTLRAVLNDHWPEDWSTLSEPRQRYLERVGWNEHLYHNYRVCDRYYLKLLTLRFRERIKKQESKSPLQLPDAIFDDGKDPPMPVRFVGESGSYKAGTIAAAEKAKLPRDAPDALAIVQQLVVWMPDDLRLYWLLGDLYNAQGGKNGILSALQIFSELYTGLELSKDTAVSEETRSQLKERLKVLSAAKEVIDAEAAKDFNKKFDELDKRDGAALQVDWSTVAISFGVGFLLALFVVWQVREIQRRRARRASGGV